MEKRLDAICVGAAVVDIPLRPVCRDMFEIESYPLEQISMTIGGDAINEATILRVDNLANGCLELTFVIRIIQ